MFPFNPFSTQNEWRKLIQNPDQLNVNQFLNDFMKQFDFENDEIKQSKSEKKPAEIFESFDHIYIQIDIPLDKIKEMKVVHTIDQLFVYHNKEIVTEITLPSLVSKNGGIAQIEGRVLQIRLVKVSDTQSIELHID